VWQGKTRQPPVILVLRYSPPSAPTQSSPALDYSPTQPITKMKPSISKPGILFPQPQVYNSKALTTITQTALSPTIPNKPIKSYFQILFSLTSAKSLEARNYSPLTFHAHLHVAFQSLPITSPAPQILKVLGTVFSVRDSYPESLWSQHCPSHHCQLLPT